MVFIHAAFVVAETTLLVYMAVRSSREALDADVSALGSRASANGDIDLSIVKGSAVGKSAQDFEDFLLGIGNAVAGTRIVAADVHSTSQLLGQATEQIRVNADETSSLASLASTAAESVSKSIGVVASGSEQLQNSMHSISDSANEAARVAKSAVEIAHETNVTVGKLGESSEEIGQFVKVITSIAQQTNLLALNATIESARAGDAGKGFAVVANEVKELAKATAKATEEIGKKIHAIRADTQAAVAAIENIGNVINQINHISNTITSAVEQQIATTSEVTRNVGDAATSANDIAANMSRVVQAAQNTTSRIGETQDASRVLAVTASKLETLVGKFKLQPQSATETLQLRSAAAGR
jgi:methyl-accepting chemotaxis protein